MPHLIVGDTTDRTARIWVRGAWWCSTCDIAIDPPPPEHPAVRTIQLMPATDYTGTVDFEGLAPDTNYAVAAAFSFLRRQTVSGRFRTFPASLEKPETFSFVLSSCNLSVVSVSNLLAFLLAIVGVQSAKGSLALPLERWRLRWLLPLWVVLRPAAKLLLLAVAWFIKTVTGMKQPAPPYLRSPFLKLSAVFESQVIEIDSDARVFLTAGDVVSTASGARGVVACSVAGVGDPTEDGKQTGPWRAVLTQVEGQFKENDTAFKLPVGSPAPKHQAGRISSWLVGRYRLPLSMEPWKWIGPISKVSDGRVWHDRPSFFVHAGDQIYYDFPFESRRPKTRQYRLAYREAWFDDYAHGHVLSHWPHYMTLDDHEIADQFARDFVPPANDSTPLAYLEKASVAYREYVHSRSPSSVGEAGRRATESFWYSFDKGSTRYFVLDTRTQRLDHGVDGSQMIDERQMEQLLKWMTTYKEDLKFVVTSVPFVAEINDTPKVPTPKWNSQDRPGGSARSAVRRNPANDKWCATRFERQRHQIIDHIAANDIEHLVFLTGDMHCCYHATMQIGSGSKYEAITVHELAGGPVNQLQLAGVTDFHTRYAGSTSCNAYEVVLDRFHGEVNAVMHLKVWYEPRELIVGTDRAGKVPIVDWNVIRTLTDDGPAPWYVEPPSVDSKGRVVVDKPRAPEATMAGRITFVRKRRLGDLAPWPRAMV